MREALADDFGPVAVPETSTVVIAGEPEVVARPFEITGYVCGVIPLRRQSAANLAGVI